MAKNITRTITVNAYTFGTFNPKTAKVDDIRVVTSPLKLGQRELAKLTRKGEALLSHTTEEKLYKMSIEDFIKYATPAEEEE